MKSSNGLQLNRVMAQLNRVRAIQLKSQSIWNITECVRVTTADYSKFISQFLHYYTYNLALASLATVDLIKPLGSEDG